MSAAFPTVTDREVTFRVSDVDHEFSRVRLELDWDSHAGTLDFSQAPDSEGPEWSLTIPRPAADRFEYQLTVRVGEDDHRILDPGNPRQVANPFGPKSEILLPGYVEPDWLGTANIGQRRSLSIAPELTRPVPVSVWSPTDLDPQTPAPLLMAHDGSDLAERGSLLEWASFAASVQDGPGLFRVALLDPAPGYRDEWYSANDAYADHCATVLMPTLLAALPTTKVIGLGASLGALSLLHLQGRHREIFDGLALQSGSFFTPTLDPQESDYQYFNRISTAVERLSTRPADANHIPVLLTCGQIEENLANNERMARTLSNQGYQVRWKPAPDAHTMIGWRNAWGTDLVDLMTAANSRQPADTTSHP